MIKIITLFTVAFVFHPGIQAQVLLNYNPGLQSKTSIQYFKPSESDLFVGDCIPFSHEGVFYLYWLIDKGHHSLLDGLGGHQWVLS